MTRTPFGHEFQSNYTIAQQVRATKTNPIVEHYNQVQLGEIPRSKPNNLRFPKAVTPQQHSEEFFSQEHVRTTPSRAISDTIWFKNDDPTKYAKADHDSYNPLSSFLNWAKILNENKLHNFNIQTFHQQQQQLLEFIPCTKRKR